MMKDETKTGVYQIVHLASGKRYVGSAGLSFKNRWRQHRQSLKKGKHHSVLLQRAWNKYGADNFKFSILEVTRPEWVVDVEQTFIDAWKTSNPTYGYNIAPTAGSQLGVKWTDEQRAAKSANAKIAQNRPEVRAAKSARAKLQFSSVEARAANAERSRIIGNKPDRVAAASARSKAQFASAEARAKHSEILKISHSRPEIREKISRQVKKLHSRPESRAANSARSKVRCSLPGVREAMSKTGKIAHRRPGMQEAARKRTLEYNSDPIRKAAKVAKMNATRIANRLRKEEETKVNQQGE